MADFKRSSELEPTPEGKAVHCSGRSGHEAEGRGGASPAGAPAQAQPGLRASLHRAWEMAQAREFPCQARPLLGAHAQSVPTQRQQVLIHGWLNPRPGGTPGAAGGTGEALAPGQGVSLAVVS